MPADGSTHQPEIPAALAPYFAIEQAKEEVRLAPVYQSGVRYSGMGDVSRTKPRSFGEMIADAGRAKAERDAFRASPRGRFLACLREFEQTGSAADADRLRGIYQRALTNGPDWPLDTAAIGSALIILEVIQTSTAREARLALCEILVAGKVA